ncbi:hypothetical protein ABK040_008200 [Willaertia magna]
MLKLFRSNFLSTVASPKLNKNLGKVSLIQNNKRSFCISNSNLNFKKFVEERKQKGIEENTNNKNSINKQELTENIDTLLAKVLEKVKIQRDLAWEEYNKRKESDNNKNNEDNDISSLKNTGAAFNTSSKIYQETMNRGESTGKKINYSELFGFEDEDIRENEENISSSLFKENSLEEESSNELYELPKDENERKNKEVNNNFTNENKKKKGNQEYTHPIIRTNNFYKSIGINYRGKLVQDRLPHSYKILCEFPHAEYTQLTPTSEEQKEYVGDTDLDKIPKLSNGLDQVLQTPGVHQLYDPRSKKHHFPPSLRFLHQPNQINFANLTPFIPPSNDKTLHDLVLKHNCTYRGSTSSITAPLVSIYLILSNYRPTHARALDNFKHMSNTFTPSVVKPILFCVRPKESEDGRVTYSIDSFKFIFEPRTNQILMDLGKTMEKLFVMSQKDFQQRFVLAHSDGKIYDDCEIYRYLHHGKFLLRSQLDCYHPDHGVFDIKTRAINPIRVNMERYTYFTKSRLENVKGTLLSYEREFYDLIRSAFIKYSMQARIGNMDGMFISYHNTREIFGFEYVKLEEIDKYVFGNSINAGRAFSLSLDIFTEVLDTFTERFPKSPLRVTFRPLKVEPYFIDIFVEPMEEDEGWSERDATEEEKLMWDNMRYQNNPFEGIIGNAYCYRLSIQAFVNGGISKSHLDLKEGDDIDVMYSLEELGETANDLFLSGEYISTLKKAFYLERTT